MFERTGQDKEPLRLLLGPSTAMMINWSMAHDFNVKSVIDGLENKILDNYF